MTPNKEYIISLARKKGWHDAELARKTGVSRTEISRFIHGDRKGGSKLIGGIIKAFPEEPMDKLFFYQD